MKTITEEQKRAIIAEIEANQPEIFWDYCDELSNDDICAILNGHLYDVECAIWENNIEYIDDLETGCIEAACNKILIDVSEYEIEDYLDIFREHCCVDLNINDLLKRTEARIRLTLYSNYDCMNSNYSENSGGYEYDENYFTDMVKFLQINPAELQKSMSEQGFKTVGEWPNITNLNPIVNISDFLVELNNNCGGAVNYCIIGKIKLSDITGNIAKVICHAGTMSGLYDESYGSGSVLECSLIRDFEIDLTKRGATEYDKVHLSPDIKGAGGYCTDEVYGLTSNCYKNITVIN